METFSRIITPSEFASDCMVLMSKLLSEHPDVDMIVGVPRSGLVPATLIATTASIPLGSVTSAPRDRVVEFTYGRRSRALGLSPKNKIAIIEDSVNTGRGITQAARRMFRDGHTNLVRCAVYTTPIGAQCVDVHAVVKPLPHYFTWHFFGSHIYSYWKFGFDMDGVICHDCPVDDDDDGPRYSAWLDTVEPKFLPRPHVVPMIVTGRLEKYRPQTEAYLARHGVRYKKLVMAPWETAKERSNHCIGSWKASMIKNVCDGFVESDPRQAAVIAHKLPRKQVLCTCAARSRG